MEPRVQPVESRAVVSDGRHNAFAAFTHWRDVYWLAHRSATGHISRDGDILLRRSLDTHQWQDVTGWDVAQDDRDPQWLTTDDRLFLYINSLEEGSFESRVCYTQDGVHWSDPVRVYEPGFILWKPVEYNGSCYAAAHRPGPNPLRESHLIRSQDGIDWQKVSTIRAGQGESETALLFGEEGRITAFLRSQERVGGAILEADPPYETWNERPAEFHLSGHAAYRFEGATYLLGRWLAYDPPVPPDTLQAELSDHYLDQATMIYAYENGHLQPYCRLGPLDGNHDSSYPTAVQDGDDLLVVHHRAAHVFAGDYRAEDAADLFLSRVPLLPQGSCPASGASRTTPDSSS